MVDISREDFPNTTLNKVYWTKYNMYESTLNDNDHQNTVNKTLQITYFVEDLTTYSNYKTENNLVFCGSDQGFSNIALHVKVEEREITKGGKFTSLNISAYQGRQISEKPICATTEGNKLISLKLTTHMPRAQG